MELLPPQKEKTLATSIRIPVSLLKELDAIAAEIEHDRTALVLHWLRRAVLEYRSLNKGLAGRK